MEIKKTETEREGKDYRRAEIDFERERRGRGREGGNGREAEREREWVIVYDRGKERGREHLHNVLHHRKSLRLAMLDN